MIVKKSFISTFVELYGLKSLRGIKSIVKN